MTITNKEHGKVTAEMDPWIVSVSKVPCVQSSVSLWSRSNIKRCALSSSRPGISYVDSVMNRQRNWTEGRTWQIL